MDIYARLDYDEWKSLERQCKEFNETEHGKGTDYYHKSFRLKIGEITLEFHAPLVATRALQENTKAGCDSLGRKWAKMSKVYEGTVLEVDEGFTCMPKGHRKIVKRIEGRYYVDCDDGLHLLDGQISDRDCDSLIGFYPG